MGPGHWHSPMNRKETDPSPGIPVSHLVSSPTTDGKGEMRRRCAGGGEEACLWAFEEHTRIVDTQQLAVYPDGCTYIPP